jgi:hypothetical protein
MTNPAKRFAVRLKRACARVRARRHRSIHRIRRDEKKVGEGGQARPFLIATRHSVLPITSVL